MNRFVGASPVYTPTAPFQIRTTSTMSQDVVSTATVTLASEAVAPVAPFVNPQADGEGSNPQVEALVVAAPGQGGATVNTLCHVRRDGGTDGGWSVVTLFGGRAVSGVAAGTAYATSTNTGIYAIFQDDPSVSSPALWSSQFDPAAATWSDPQQIVPGTLAGLRTTYDPNGGMVVYGVNSTGDLVAVHQTQVGGPFTATTFQTGGALAGAPLTLCVTDPMGGFNALAIVEGAVTEITGTLASTTVNTSQPSISSGGGAFTGVVLGYWNSVQSALVYLLVDASGNLSAWTGAGQSTSVVPIQIPNSSVTSATGVITGPASQPILHVYSLDAQDNLWVLHQDPNTPWNDDGTPNFAPYLPLDTGIGGVIADSNPTDVVNLLGWDGDYGLHLHAQDPVTSMWSGGLVQQSSTQTYEVVRFRTEVTLLDANAIPVPSYPVTLQVAPNYSATNLSVSGQLVAVGSQAPVSLTTDAGGKLTFAIMTTAGMVAPDLLVAADQLPAQTLSPAAPVHTYLSGTGTLNPTNPSGPLPTFDSGGATLTAAQSDGGPLCPALAPGNNPPATLASTAATNIQLVAGVGLSASGGGASQLAARIARGEIAGWAGSLRSSSPHVRVFHTREELEARLGSIAPEDIFDDLEQWAGDLWSGIKSGLIKIGDYIASAADQVIHFAVQIGDDITGWVQLAVNGLEQAAAFIAGVFQALEADVDKVIDWLKAVFDFAAIWRTQQAILTALTGAPAYLQQFVTVARNATDGWFSKQEQTVNQYFSQLQQQYAGTSMSGLPGWQTPGQPASSTPAMGNAAPADATNNVHGNWAQDKFQSYAQDSAMPSVASVGTSLSPLLGSMQSGGSASALVQGFTGAFESFKAGIGVLFTDPSQFSTLGVSDFLAAAKDLVQALLALCDGIADGVLDFSADALTAIGVALAAPIDLGPFNAIWSWIAEQGGQKPAPPPTVGGVFALLGAFPTTILYKLALGFDQEPFPPPKEGSAAPLSLFNSLGVQCQKAGALLQVLYVVPTLIGDALGANAPLWLSLLKAAWCLAIFFLIHGVPDLSALEWGASGAALLFAAFLAYVVNSILNIARLWLSEQAVNELMNDALCVLFTVYGAGMFIYGIVLDCIETSTDAEIATRLLLPLPSLFALFSTTEMRDFVWVQFLMDVVGYVGGGITEFMEYQQPSSLAASSSSSGSEVLNEVLA